MFIKRKRRVVSPLIYAAIKFTDIHKSALSVKERVRLEHDDAYSLLSCLYEKIYGKQMPNIARAERGKPYFLGEGTPSFNISHTDGAALAVIDTSDAEIGADIQIEVSDEKAQKICKRFPFINNAAPSVPITDYKLLVFHNGGLSEPSAQCTPTLDTQLSDFSAKWALTEAILKAEGGGFTSARNFLSIKPRASLSFIINNYRFSIASL